MSQGDHFPMNAVIHMDGGDKDQEAATGETKSSATPAIRTRARRHDLGGGEWPCGERGTTINAGSG